MRFRKRSGSREAFPSQMTAMIDIVFLLLIFFMLSLKITAKEGDFQLDMPARRFGGEEHQLKVRLFAHEEGTLKDVTFNFASLGTGDDAFVELNRKVRRAVGFRNGRPLLTDVEVEIQADYNLDYQYAVKALSACTGTMQKTADGEMQLFRYVEKIKFAPPQSPE